MMLEKKQYWMTLLLAIVTFLILFITTYFISVNGSKVVAPMVGQVAQLSASEMEIPKEQFQIAKILPSTKVSLCLKDEDKETIESVIINADSLLGLTEEELQERFKDYRIEMFNEEEVKLSRMIQVAEVMTQTNAVRSYALGIDGEKVCIREVGTGNIVGHVARRATDFSSYIYSLFLKGTITITEVQKETLLKDPSVLQKILQDYVGE